MAGDTPTETVQLVTFAVPGSSTRPMEVKVAHSGLRMVLVSRESIRLLDESWRVLGVYFLLGAAEDPDRYCAYVGEVGKATLVQRLRHHAAQKDWWSRALLIASASDEFNSAEIGWLEGRLYDVLNNAVACELKNGNRPGDNSLSIQMRGVLERYVEPIMAALRALGASPDTADQKPDTTGKKKAKYFSESVSDLLAADLLKPETTLHPLKKNVTETARVLADGQLEVSGVVYGSLSAAAKAASGAIAEAGWDFWGAPSGTGGFVPLATLRDRLREGLKPVETPIPEPSEPVSSESDQPAGAPHLSTLAAVSASTPERFPLPIFADYHGNHIEATVELSGEIRLGSEVYASPSTAAKAAKKLHGYGGAGKAATNGWDFWRFKDADGQVKPLDALRHPA